LVTEATIVAVPSATALQPLHRDHQLNSTAGRRQSQSTYRRRQTDDQRQLTGWLWRPAGLCRHASNGRYYSYAPKTTATILWTCSFSHDKQAAKMSVFRLQKLSRWFSRQNPIHVSGSISII